MKKIVLIISFIMMIIGCGGGGGGTTPDTTTPDTIAPVITINGDNPETVIQGETYVDVEATATDDRDGSVAVITTGSVDTSTIGIYTITYTATDSSDNTATKTRTVNVLPEYISISDIVFADTLTRLGYPVNDGQMKTSDALRIEKLCITSMYGYYGEADENDTAIFDNPNVPDTGVRCAYTDGYITNTTGLESFLNLQTMRLEVQQFQEINLSTLKKLSFLSLWKNPLSNLDVSNNTELTSFGLSETSLTSIDTSKLTKLIEAAFQNSSGSLPYTTSNGTIVYGFASLDFSQNQNITRVYLHNNPLTDFGISQNKDSLRELWANETLIETLDLSGYEKLNYIILRDSSNLEYLNIVGVNYGNVPFRLYCLNCPSLNEIIVTSVSATQAAIDSGVGVGIDDHIQLVEGL